MEIKTENGVMIVDEKQIPRKLRVDMGLESGSETLATMDKADVVATALKAEVSLVTNAAETLIPVEELGMEVTEEDEYADAAAQGYFSEVIGMGKVETEDGLMFYADIYNQRGRINYEIRLQLPNGDFSPKVTIHQSDLVLAVNNNFIANKTLVPKLKNHLDKFLANIVLDLMDIGIVYDSSSIYTILKTLFNIKDKLPVYSERDEQSERMEFYRNVVDAIRGREPFQPFMAAYLNQAKAYYPLATKEFDFIARQFKLSATGLAKKLDRFGFLYKTPSSAGYQVKLRIHTDEEAKKLGISAFDSCYCVLKLDYISQQRKSLTRQ